MILFEYNSMTEFCGAYLSNATRKYRGTYDTASVISQGQKEGGCKPRICESSLHQTSPSVVRLDDNRASKLGISVDRVSFSMAAVDLSARVNSQSSVLSVAKPLRMRLLGRTVLLAVVPLPLLNRNSPLVSGPWEYLSLEMGRFVQVSAVII